MPSTAEIIFQAEIEHGPIHIWNNPWYEDDMYAQYNLGEIDDLGLEFGMNEDVQASGIDLRIEGYDPDWDDDGFDDDGWDFRYGWDRQEQQKSQLTVPAGMIIWMECNHPGRIYISGRDRYDWSNYNGYMPAEVSWNFAMAVITNNDPDKDGPWDMEICGPLSAECVEKMAEAKAREADNADL